MPERRTHAEVRERVIKRMAVIDSQSPEIRALVHEFGWNVVKLFLDNGLRNATQIKHIIGQVRRDLGTTLPSQDGGS